VFEHGAGAQVAELGLDEGAQVARVRCSTLNTECKSLLCLMIMPGRSWVAGIDIAGLHLLHSARNFWTAGQGPGSPAGPLWPAGVELAGASAALRINTSFYTGERVLGTGPAGNL